MDLLSPSWKMTSAVLRVTQGGDKLLNRCTTSPYNGFVISVTAIVVIPAPTLAIKAPLTFPIPPTIVLMIIINISTTLRL